MVADPAAWFASETTNLVTAVELGCDLGLIDAVDRIATYLMSFCVCRSRYDERQRIYRTILAAAKRIDDQRSRLLESICLG